METSAHENVNVDLAFLVLAQMVDKAKNRMRVVPFTEAARSRKDVLDVATEAYQRLIRAQVTDFRAVWSATSKKLAPNPDYIHYCHLFGHDDAQRLFRRHVKKLKDEHLARKIKGPHRSPTRLVRSCPLTGFVAIFRLHGHSTGDPARILPRPAQLRGRRLGSHQRENAQSPGL